MNKSPSPMIFMGLTALTILLGGGLIFMQYGSLNDTQAKVAQLRKDKKDEGQLQGLLQQSMNDVQQAQARLNHLEQGIPDVAYVPTMLKELESVGTQNGIEVTGVRPVPKPASAPPKDGKDVGKTVKKAYDELDIEVTGRGSYKAVKSFVTALESFPKIVAARTISLEPKVEGGSANKDPGAPKLQVTISLRSYLFSNKSADSTTAMNTSGVKPNAG